MQMSPTHNRVPPTNMGWEGTSYVTETNPSSERESGVEERKQEPISLVVVVVGALPLLTPPELGPLTSEHPRQ